jgi:hypothetical protein
MPSLLDGMNVALRRAALEARTCSTNGQRGGVERGSGGRIPRKVQAGGVGSVGDGGKRESRYLYRRPSSSCRDHRRSSISRIYS